MMRLRLSDLDLSSEISSKLALGLRLALASTLLLLVFLAYQGAPQNSFQFDDFPNIVDHDPVKVTQPSPRALIEAFSNPAMTRRPLPSLTFAFDWWRGGGSARAFIQTNLMVHSLASLAVYWLLLLALVPKGRASNGWTEIMTWLGAALWSIHPIQVQAVTYVVQRMTSMAALFTVLCVATYLKARLGSSRTGAWYFTSVLCLGLGLLSKENAAIAPVLILLAEFYLVRKPGEVLRNRFDVALLLAPVAVLLSLSAALALRLPVVDWLVGGYAYRDFTLGQRLLTQPRVFFFHLSQISLPHPDRFSLSHSLPVSTGLLSPVATIFAMVGILVWLAIGLLLARRNTRYRSGGFFVLWVLVACLVEFTFIPLEMVYEHRMYLPSIGLAGLLAWVLLPPGTERKPGRLRLALGLLLLISLVPVIGATRERVSIWRDPVTLWSDAVRNSPGGARAHNNLGEALWKQGVPLQALDHFERSVDLDSDYQDALLNLARSYGALGRFSEAQSTYEKALSRFPREPEVHFSFGMFLLEQGRLEDARAQFEVVLSLDPDYPQARGFLRFVEVQTSPSN